MPLSRLWRCQCERTDAYQLLIPIYLWFTKSFTAADLQEAKGLLAELY
jgi:hypothetical protein